MNLSKGLIQYRDVSDFNFFTGPQRKDQPKRACKFLTANTRQDAAGFAVVVYVNCGVKLPVVKNMFCTAIKASKADQRHNNKQLNQPIMQTRPHAHFIMLQLSRHHKK